jgi:hypothetical protein
LREPRREVIGFVLPRHAEGKSDEFAERDVAAMKVTSRRKSINRIFRNLDYATRHKNETNLFINISAIYPAYLSIARKSKSACLRSPLENQTQFASINSSPGGKLKCPIL